MIIFYIFISCSSGTEGMNDEMIMSLNNVSMMQYFFCWFEVAFYHLLQGGFVVLLFVVCWSSPTVYFSLTLFLTHSLTLLAHRSILTASLLARFLVSMVSLVACPAQPCQCGWNF
jgi:hypothetical protein